MEWPLPWNTFYPLSGQDTRHNSLIHYSGVKPQKNTEEDTQYTCEPLGDLRYLFRTIHECHSDEHPQIKFLGIRLLRIALKSHRSLIQDSSKEPTQLGMGCAPKQTGDGSPDL